MLLKSRRKVRRGKVTCHLSHLGIPLFLQICLLPFKPRDASSLLTHFCTLSPFEVWIRVQSLDFRGVAGACQRGGQDEDLESRKKLQQERYLECNCEIKQLYTF